MAGILAVFLIMGILIWQGIKEFVSFRQANDMKKMSYDEYHDKRWEEWKKKNGY